MEHIERNGKNPPQDRFCPECGQKLIAWETSCPQCGYLFEKQGEDKVICKERSEYGRPAYQAK